MDKLHSLENAIRELLDTPDDWTMTDQTLIHKSGLVLWTANSDENFAVYKPESLNFSSDEIRSDLKRRAEIARAAISERIASALLDLIQIEKELATWR